MSRTTRVILFLFTALLLLFSIFWFTPASHLASPIVAKLVSFFKQQQDSSLLETNIYQDVYYVDASKNHEDDSHSDNNPVVDEKDVVVLTHKNFSDFIARNPFVMVNFYASWCFWSRRLLPEYSAAATMLKGEAVLAKVDASEEMDLSRKYHIQGYPTMSLYVDGVLKVQYFGERKRDAIAAWMRHKMGPAVQTVTTTEEAAESILANSVIVMGFLDTLEGPDAVELDAASELHTDINFYQTTNDDVARLLGINPQIERPALVMLKWELANHSLIDFDGEFNRAAISYFVYMNKDASVITITPKDAPHFLKFPMKQLWLFAPKHSWELVSSFKEAAKNFKQKLLFLYVETANEPAADKANLAYRLGLADGASGIVAYMGNDHAKHIYHGELTLCGIKSFIEEFLDDKLSTQSVPTSKTVLLLPSDSHLSDTSSLSS